MFTVNESEAVVEESIAKSGVGVDAPVDGSFEIELPSIEVPAPPAEDIPGKKVSFFRRLLNLRSREHTVLSLILAQVILIVVSFLTCAAAVRLQNKELHSTISWITDHFDRFLLSSCIILLINEFIYLIFYRPWVSVAVTYPLMAVLYIANDIKLFFRDEPFLVTDLASMREAMGMSGQFSVPFKKVYIYAVFGFIALLAFSLIVRPLRPKIKIRLAAAALGLTCVILFGNFQIVSAESYLTRIYKKRIWNNKGEYKDNGALLGFIYSIKRCYMPVPDKYGEDTVGTAAKLLQYADPSFDISAIPEDELPNIIAIMNESWWDPTNYHTIEFNINPMQPIYDLVAQGNTRLSYHVTNQLGGGTSNVEYEFLTGKSLKFYPPETNVYQNIVSSTKENTWSLAWYLKDLGYHTLALHSYEDWFWKRNENYPKLGFAEQYFKNDFVNNLKKGEYIADEQTALEMIMRAEPHKDKPLFMFTVTMQNHGGYWASKYDKDGYDIDVSGDLSKAFLGQVRDYSQGVYDAAKMFVQLTEYYKDVERPTYILMFGDHGPSISTNLDLFYEDDDLTEQDNLNVYSPPMVMWSNTGKTFDPEDQTPLQSTFMMMTDLLDFAGLPLPAQASINKYVRENYTRGFTNLFTLNKEGKVIYDTSSLDEAMRAMDLLQYDSTKGKQYVVKEYKAAS